MLSAAIIAAPACAALAQVPVASAAVPASGSSNPADGATNAGPNDEIVVTASKRPERLRDVPSAITAISAETINRLGVGSIRDYATLTPGLSLRDGGAPGVGTVILRGLNTGSNQVTNTTALYLDDTPFSASGFLSIGSRLAPSPELSVVDHIEVLKGPQGTLYGASSLGGLVRVVSRSPDSRSVSGEFYTEGSVVDGGGAGALVRGWVNMPVVHDTLAVMASGYYRHAPGFIDNAVTGRDNVNDSDSEGGRLAVRWTPAADWTVDLTGMYERTDNNQYASEYEKPGTLTPLYGRYKTGTLIDPKSRFTYGLASGRVEHRFGALTWTTTASYARYKTSYDADSTPTYGPFLGLVGYPANSGLAILSTPEMTKYTAESRLTSQRLGRFEFVAGIFYTHEDAPSGLVLRAYSTPDGKTYPAPLGVLIFSNQTSKYREIAGFGNATFYLSDRLDLTGGFRYAHSVQDATTTVGGLAAAPSGTAGHLKADDKNYLATLRWRPTDRISTYLRFATGYRPGGFQTAPVVPAGAQTVIRPDTVYNYEGGVKGSFADGRITANAAIYHIDWRNVQLNGSYVGFVLQGNAGAARVDGAEVELTVKPTSSLTVSANAGYTKARISEIDASAQASLGAAPGDRLPGTPRFSAAIVADQKIPLNNRMDLTLGGTLRHQSSVSTSYPGSALDLNFRLPSITTVDLRGGISLDRWTFQARIDNLLNKHALSLASEGLVAAGQQSPVNATVIRPRTFSLSADLRF